MRVADLRKCVAFVPMHQKHNGVLEIDVAAVDFWDRKQYVVGFYQGSNSKPLVIVYGFLNPRN